MATISCADNPGTVIQITFANFGRSSTSICVPTAIEDIVKGQRTDCLRKVEHVLVLARSECQGKTQCELKAYAQIFGDTCPGTFKYLEVHYYCKIKGKILIVNAKISMIKA